MKIFLKGGAAILLAALPNATSAVAPDFSASAEVLVIEGGADVAAPGSEDFTILKRGVALPIGSHIRTYESSVVVLRGVGGSLIKIEADSEMVLDELTLVPAARIEEVLSKKTETRIMPKSASPAQAVRQPGQTVTTQIAPEEKAPEPEPDVVRTELLLLRGSTSFIFNEFSKNPKLPSFFKIQTPQGIAAARGGSGYINAGDPVDGDASASIGVLTGVIDFETESGHNTSVNSGNAVSLSAAQPGPEEPITAAPQGEQRVADVLQLAGRGRAGKFISDHEMNIAIASAARRGLNSDRIQQALRRNWRPEATLEQVNKMRARFRERIDKLSDEVKQRLKIRSQRWKQRVNELRDQRQSRGSTPMVPPRQLRNQSMHRREQNAEDRYEGFNEKKRSPRQGGKN